MATIFTDTQAAIEEPGPGQTYALQARKHPEARPNIRSGWRPGNGLEDGSPAGYEGSEWARGAQAAGRGGEGGGGGVGCRGELPLFLLCYFLCSSLVRICLG